MSTVNAVAQTFQNVRATAQGDVVVITYDLVASSSDGTFNVELYCSVDNYAAPLTGIGDIGPNVTPGYNKRVEWNALSALQTYKGDVTFELRGRPVVLKFGFQSPTAGRSVKKGKTTTIQWQGGTAMQQVKITLHRNDQMIGDVTQMLNRGRFEWTVPNDLEKGDGYFLRLSSGSETVESGRFAVKGKTPMLLVLSPIAVGGAVLMLSGDNPPSGGGGGGGGNTENTALPTPPGPPGS